MYSGCVSSQLLVSVLFIAVSTNTENSIFLYSTAQLQGNVRTRLKRVQDASGTHVRRVHASEKPCNKAATRRTRVPRPFFARRWARPERV